MECESETIYGYSLIDDCSCEYMSVYRQLDRVHYERSRNLPVSMHAFASQGARVPAVLHGNKNESIVWTTVTVRKYPANLQAQPVSL
jgi:hypothetical protein